MRAVPALLLVLVVTVTVPSSALDCYACRPNRNFTITENDRNVTLQLHTAIEALVLADFPTCEAMGKEAVPSNKFKQRCSAADRGCAKFVDPEDDENIIRTCFPVDKDECDDSVCYCNECLCNSAAGVPGSLVMMIAAFGAITLVG